MTLHGPIGQPVGARTSPNPGLWDTRSGIEAPKQRLKKQVRAD